MVLIPFDPYFVGLALTRLATKIICRMLQNPIALAFILLSTTKVYSFVLFLCKIEVLKGMSIRKINKMEFLKDKWQSAQPQTRHAVVAIPMQAGVLALTYPLMVFVTRYQVSHATTAVAALCTRQGLMQAYRGAPFASVTDSLKKGAGRCTKTETSHEATELSTELRDLPMEPSGVEVKCNAYFQASSTKLYPLALSAGITWAFVPTTTIKTLQQLDGGTPKNILKNLFVKNAFPVAVRKLWSGSAMNLARDVGFVALYFPLNQYLARECRQQMKQETLPLSARLTLSMFAGITVALVTHWFDLIAKHQRKQMLQEGNPSLTLATKRVAATFFDSLKRYPASMLACAHVGLAIGLVDHVAEATLESMNAL